MNQLVLGSLWLDQIAVKKTGLIVDNKGTRCGMTLCPVIIERLEVWKSLLQTPIWLFAVSAEKIEPL
jgi:hypothetical protein